MDSIAAFVLFCDVWGWFLLFSAGFVLVSAGLCRFRLFVLLLRLALPGSKKRRRVALPGSKKRVRPQRQGASQRRVVGQTTLPMEGALRQQYDDRDADLVLRLRNVFENSMF